MYEMSDRSKSPINLFDCIICGDSLTQKGPQLSTFSFGRLFDGKARTPEELDIIREDFPGYDIACEKFAIQNKRGRIVYDCNKIMATPCGHLFHSGCIREWYFVNRLAPLNKCPYCMQRARLSDCMLVYPIGTALGATDSDENTSPNKLKKKRDLKVKRTATRGTMTDVRIKMVRSLGTQAVSKEKSEINEETKLLNSSLSQKSIDCAIDCILENNQDRAHDEALVKLFSERQKQIEDSICESSWTVLIRLIMSLSMFTATFAFTSKVYMDSSSIDAVERYDEYDEPVFFGYAWAFGIAFNCFVCLLIDLMF